jgi:hypothetical protein
LDLVGGLEHLDYFSSWEESSHLTFIFFRKGRSTTKQFIKRLLVSPANPRWDELMM